MSYGNRDKDYDEYMRADKSIWIKTMIAILVLGFIVIAVL
jgi:hypothetical protein